MAFAAVRSNPHPSPEIRRLESFPQWRLAARCSAGSTTIRPLEARGAFPRALLQARPATTAPSRLGTRAPMFPQGCRRNAQWIAARHGVCAGSPSGALSGGCRHPIALRAGLTVVARHRRARQGRREQPLHCVTSWFVAERTIPIGRWFLPLPRQRAWKKFCRPGPGCEGATLNGHQ